MKAISKPFRTRVWLWTGEGLPELKFFVGDEVQLIATEPGGLMTVALIAPHCPVAKPGDYIVWEGLFVRAYSPAEFASRYQLES
jgi:hypothetical protein